MRGYGWKIVELELEVNRLPGGWELLTTEDGVFVCTPKKASSRRFAEAAKEIFGTNIYVGRFPGVAVSTPDKKGAIVGPPAVVPPVGGAYQAVFLFRTWAAATAAPAWS